MTCVEGGVEDARPFGADGQPLGIRVGRGRGLPAVVLELGIRLDGPSLSRPLHVHRGVDRDPAEPAPDTAAAKRAKVPERREERFLDGVGGLVAVGYQAHDERKEVILVVPDEVVERVEVTRSGTLDEAEVSALGEIVRSCRADPLAAPGTLLHAPEHPPGRGSRWQI